MDGVAYRSTATVYPRFLRVLWAVLFGYVAAGVTLLLALLALTLLGVFVWGQSTTRPGPFPVTGAWSLDADIVLAAAAVLLCAWWIRVAVAEATGREVSLAVVAAAVALTGYAPFLALRPVALSGIVALPATTWLVRRFALDRRTRIVVSRRRVALLALAGAAVVGSYLLYHPLTMTGEGGGEGSGGAFRTLTLKNAGLADLTILRVRGGPAVAAPPSARAALLLPLTLRGRHALELAVRGGTCTTRTLTFDYVVLGRTASQPVTLRRFACGG
jgi:hypothetical protein